MFETFLNELAKTLQFSTLAPDENGACLIIMKKEKVPLLFELDTQLVPNKILLSSPLIPFPIERRAEIYEFTLIENAVEPNTLSIKPDEDQLYLHTRINPDCKSDNLELVIQNFLKQTQSVKNKIETLLHQPPKFPQVPPSPSSIQVFPYKA